MIEVFKDKKMRKSMLLSTSVISFLSLVVFGISDKCPWGWMTILAWTIFFGFVFVFLTIILAIVLYDELGDED